MNRIKNFFLLTMAVPGFLLGAELEIKFTPAHHIWHLPMQVAIDPVEGKEISMLQCIMKNGNDEIPCELESSEDKWVASWIEPDALAGEEKSYRLQLTESSVSKDWDVTEDGITLFYKGDTAVDLAHGIENTHKSYHRIFGFEGERISKDIEGQYSHHRGFYMGWRHIMVGEDTVYNTWHGGSATVLREVDPVKTRAGKISASQFTTHEWLQGKRDDGAPAFARDTRDYKFWRYDNKAMILDAKIQIKALVDDLSLRGDPQHGGVQFRAHESVGGNKKQTTIVFPENAQEDKERWGDTYTNIQWIGMLFTVKDNRNAAVHMTHPENTEGTYYRYAWRDYGRIGSFAEYDNVTEPINLQHRMLFMNPSEVPDSSASFYEGLYQTWVNPPEILVDGNPSVSLRPQNPAGLRIEKTGKIFDQKGRRQHDESGLRPEVNWKE